MEIHANIDTQTVIEIIVDNSDAITRMEKEIMEISTKKEMEKVVDDVIELRHDTLVGSSGVLGSEGTEKNSMTA